MLYQKGSHASKENAVAECRNLFASHWGRRIANIMLPLHKINFHVNDMEENDDDLL